jgi:hypothetical protein
VLEPLAETDVGRKFGEMLSVVPVCVLGDVVTVTVLGADKPVIDVDADGWGGVDVSVGPEVELGEVVRGEVRADEAVLVDTEPAAHSSPNTPIVVLKSSGGHVPCAHVTLDETKFDLLHKHLTSLTEHPKLVAVAFTQVIPHCGSEDVPCPWTSGRTRRRLKRKSDSCIVHRAFVVGQTDGNEQGRRWRRDETNFGRMTEPVRLENVLAMEAHDVIDAVYW